MTAHPADQAMTPAPEEQAPFGAGLDEQPPQEIRCPSCYGSGSWESECCSGAGGCSCRGRVVDMGRCNVCCGTGSVVEGEYDRRANIRAITGLHFLGSGPAGAYEMWPNRGGFV